MTASPHLLLASTSPYRRELLQRLQLPFDTCPPEVDETPQAGEMPAALSERLALAKARMVAAAWMNRHPGSDPVVIGSDQVADVDGCCIGKPGSHERAREQLRLMSGQAVVFHTSVAVLRPARGVCLTRRVPVVVRFRSLSDAEIETYLRREQPYDCAGSAKCETLGIALVSAIESDDPTALIGLPMIAVCDLLRGAGLDPLGVAAAVVDGRVGS